MNLLDESKLRNDWCKKQRGVNQCTNTDHNKCLECVKYNDCDIEYTLRKGTNYPLVIYISVVIILVIYLIWWL